MARRFSATLPCFGGGKFMRGEVSTDQDVNTQYSFWIVPTEPLVEQLRSRIRQLAVQFDAIYFEPHVTIYSGTSNDEEIRVLASDVASRFKALELTALKLDHTDSYTRTLFIRLDDRGEARRM